jgi:hypothetical protein
MDVGNRCYALKGLSKIFPTIWNSINPKRLDSYSVTITEL